MHARNIGLIIESYQRVEADGFLIDGESEYAEWAGEHKSFKNGDKCPCRFYGMRHRETGKPHGLVRFIS